MWRVPSGNRRSIPACAGEPNRHRRPPGKRRVYPRVCGGTAETVSSTRSTTGLSPRVRGNPRHNLGAPGAVGSIPACAGEPQCRRGTDANRRVYPRVCGGTQITLTIGVNEPGLSPRVRGNRPASIPTVACQRSIPACAGEPRRVMLSRAGNRVYPRVCGGTGAYPGDCTNFEGLSPRVRGNRAAGAGAGAEGGSIPACAGEPCG